MHIAPVEQVGGAVVPPSVEPVPASPPVPPPAGVPVAQMGKQADMPPAAAGRATQ